jgi:alkanesulfonate monooxygenase SsuD/methylene tetrahydromethanopterin reductase-like flavin-dependent oxidoreductase (luciferase family)
MHVGIGLPNTLPGTDRGLLLGWMRQADEGPFGTLGVFDRLVYGSFDALAMLAAAAAVTERIRLATTVLSSPMHNTAMLAKQAASIDALSGGRLTLGLAVGARAEDYHAAGLDTRGRGNRLDEQLAEMRSIWEGGKIGPNPAQQNGPELIVGGLADVAFARAARYADGFMHNGGPPRVFRIAADKANAAWIDAGRPGKPRLWAQGYFALGENHAETGADYLRNYYAFTGPFAERIAEGLLTTPQAVAAFVRGYEEAGCDELILFPTVADIDEVARLADVIGGA